MDVTQQEYYACQLKVPGFREKGQETLQNARCLIVGLGGLGCPAALYLASSGVGTLGFCDMDRIELSNINRQVLYTMEDIGKKKIEVAKERLLRQNPYIEILLHELRLSEVNWHELLPSYDIVLDCTDNFHSKYLIHDACLYLGKPLIQGGVLQRSGQVYYFPPKFLGGLQDAAAQVSRETTQETVCLHCLWPQSPSIKNQVDCTNAGVLSLVVGNVGLQQANLALLVLLGDLPRVSVMFLYDWVKLDWKRLELLKDPDCVCADVPRFQAHMSYLHAGEALEVFELPAMPKEGLPTLEEAREIILDVRNAADQDPEIFGGRPVLGLSQEDFADFAAYLDRLREHFDEQTRFTLVCYQGIRSLGMAELMRSQGLHAYSLLGGAASLQ